MAKLFIKAVFLFFFLLMSVVFSSAPPFFVTFTPPKGWHLADLSQIKSRVEVGFIKPKKGFFTPSVTLSLEAVGEMDLTTYLTAVMQHYQKASHATYCRKLGMLNTSIGETVLLQIDVENQYQWKKICVLQAISLYAHHAIIQTATCLREDFLTMHETFLQIFKSITIYPSLITSIDNPHFHSKVETLYSQWEKDVASSNTDSKTLFLTPSFQENQWKPFVHFVEKECKAQGPCWQFLAVKYVKACLLQDTE